MTRGDGTGLDGGGWDAPVADGGRAGGAMENCAAAGGGAGAGDPGPGVQGIEAGV